VRGLIRRFDAVLRRANRVFEVSTDPDCVLRLQRGRASRSLRVGRLQLPAGAPVARLHLWNEHLPPLPAGGPDLAWAVRMRRLFVGSLRMVEGALERDPRLDGVQALGASTVLLEPHEGATSLRLMQRLGFVVGPYRNPLGWFGEFWSNLYAWGLMWVYNPATLRGRRFCALRRVEVWMPVEELRRRYGARQAPGGRVSPLAPRRGSAVADDAAGT
jgi:hypothetical protein